MEKYKLPKLNYGHKDLEPYISGEIMELHHAKHHQAYVDGANAALNKLDTARKNNEDVDQKSLLKNLSFNLAGHILHTKFWQSMAPAKDSAHKPVGAMMDAINKTFGSFERFQKEYTAAALSVEGSGWAALTHSQESGLLIMQVEKHNTNYYPEHEILLPLDVWEHAYYLDYKNARAKYIEAWWNVVNWEEIESRFTEIVTS